jgi:tetratricopeptide (TPR) repeat protein
MGLYWEQREEPARALSEYERARRGMRRSGELHAAIGRAYRAQGRWDDAIREIQEAIELDPRAYATVADLATTYSRLRRYGESVRQWDRYLALVPDDYTGMMIRGNVYLRWHGTIDTLAAVVDRLPPNRKRSAVLTRVLVARVRGRPRDALAVIDEAPAKLPDEFTLGRVPPLLRAQVYTDLHDSARAQAYFDSARVMLRQFVARRPKDFRMHVALGLALAGAGRTAEARREAELAMRLMPVTRAAPAGAAAMYGAAEIFAQLPADHDRAIALLDSLMRMPAGREASVPLLRVDPAWQPLRAEPRFQSLLARYASR